jgi:predicted Zn-dependent protease
MLLTSRPDRVYTPAMEPFQKPTWREALAERFAGSGLLRTILLNKWFGIAFVLIFLGGLLLAISLPKVWRTTPEGFVPVVRVSLLDLAQSWSLSRRAGELSAAGKTEEAMLAWQAAFANNMSDLRALRGALGGILALPEVDRRSAAAAVWQAGWLMRLGQTNQADLDLVVQVFDRCDLPEEVYSLLARKPMPLPPIQSGPYLRALFKLGMAGQFGQLWRTEREKFVGDPLMDLYDAAYRSGWGEATEMAAARRRLGEAMENPDTRNTACRLEMVVATQLNQPDAYQAALERLQDRRFDRLQDHVGYWRLLARSNRKEEAVRMAQEYVTPPNNPFELVRLAEAYVGLGLTDAALAVLRKHSGLMGNTDSAWSLAVWALYGDLLIEGKRWDELVDLASQMRLMDRARAMIEGLSFFFEGRARYGLSQFDLAFALFREAAKGRLPTPQMGLQAAITIARMSQFAIARDLLVPLEADLQAVPEYWQTLFDVAYNLREDETLLLKAATRAHELLPNNPVWTANYSVALLINRERPEEALRLTLEFLTQNPNSLVGRVNHALALIMNQRNDDAEQILRSINVSALDPHESSVFHLVSFELYLNRGELARAAAAAERVESRFLFQSQARWLERARSQVAEQSPKAR